MNVWHNPFEYRPAGADRVTVPADVCDTCSDFSADPIKLVPVAFCDTARAKSEQLYNYIHGDGPCPDWYEWLGS